MQPVGMATIRVQTRTRPPALSPLSLVHTRIQLNGGPPVLQRWGETLIPVLPGRHTITCSFPWGFFQQAGRSSVTVDAYPGQVATVNYVAPWFMFMPGTWRVGETTHRNKPSGPRSGPAITAGVGVFFALGFLFQNVPATAGHLLAAAVCGIPAILVYVALGTHATQSNGGLLLALQAVSAALTGGALLAQKVSHTAVWWLVVVAFGTIPFAISLVELSRTRASP